MADRPDPFERVWEEIRQQVETNPVLEAKTIFETLQRKNPGEFADGQLLTLQRHLNGGAPCTDQAGNHSFGRSATN